MKKLGESLTTIVAVGFLTAFCFVAWAFGKFLDATQDNRKDNARSYFRE